MNKRINNFLYEKETYKIRGAIFEIYKKFRNTQKEGVYHNSLCEELVVEKFHVEKNKQIPIYYNGKKVGVYTPDLIVNNKIIIELKAKPQLLKSDIQQFWYYLKNSGFRLGFLVNFGASGGVDIHRRIYG
jgi:GxxExxY protein